MSDEHETHVFGGGKEFLILKTDKYWEIKELNSGSRVAAIWFKRENAEKAAREYISEAISNKTGVSPRVIEVFLKVRTNK